MGILLVHSGTDGVYKNFEAVPPLGLISLSSKLPSELRQDTKLLDGNLVSSDYIGNWIERNRPEIVGISSLTFGYQTAIRIGDMARDNGAVVVLGGRHATDVLSNVLRGVRDGTRPFDYIVSGEGETVFRNLVLDFYSGRGISSQENLFSCETDDVEVRPERKSGKDEEFPVLDYSILVEESTPERYMEKLGKVGILKDVELSMPIISQRGCAYMSGESHCKFCSIPAVNPKLPIEVFEASLENLLSVTSADHIWITEGDFTANQHHARKVSDAIRRVREKTGRDFVLYCFARSDDLLRGDMVELLYETGVRAVFIGYEHGDDDILRLMKKNTTKEQNLEATRKLANVGIEVTCAGIVLGTPPETRETLQRAVGFAEELSQIGNVKSIFASPVYPFPGAPYWDEFLFAVDQEDPGLGVELRESDILEEEVLVEQFQRVAYRMPDGASKGSRPSLDEILVARGEIGDFLGEGIAFTQSF